jgi:hypothetical protein
MATSIYQGFTPQPGRWHSGVKLGHVNTLPLEFVVDETLPQLGQDQNYPNRDFVVIPRGRVIGARATTLTRLLGTTVLTLANGVSPLDTPDNLTGNFPVGYAPFHIYRDFAGLPADKPVPVMHETIEVPYTAINESYNTSTNGGTRLVVGEWLMPYFGSATSNSVTANDVGKWVRYIPKKVYTTYVASATGTVQLSEARFPAFKPSIVAGFDSAGAILTSGGTVAYNETFQRWVATFANNVRAVIYEYGAEEAMRVGMCVGIEPVGTAGGINGTSHELGGWLKWVTDQFGLWEWPPIIGRRPFTTVSNEVVSISSNVGTLANSPIDPTKAITVVVTGTLRNPDGTTTTLNGTTMSLADDMFFNDYSQGQYYDLDWLSGTLTFSSNVTVTACTVSYSYESNFRDGIKWDSGILGLTDGRDSGIIGLPPHLDVAGVRGALRIAVLP